jgi:polyribonucleotide nucleotidyltransferase
MLRRVICNTKSLSQYATRRNNLSLNNIKSLSTQAIINKDELINNKLSFTNLITNSENEIVKLGHLAEGSVLAKQGDTVVHATICSKRTDLTNVEDTSMLPLTVDYRSRRYAFGSIPEALNRRERHGTDDEILVARIIDRAIRPLFPKGYLDEVQLTVTSHASDGINDPTIVAVNAASAALMQSKQPWKGPIGCVRIGLIKDKLIVNPTVAEMETSELDLVYAGTSYRPLMIETIANQVPEKKIIEAMRLAQFSIQESIDFQLEQVNIANDISKNSIEADNISNLSERLQNILNSSTLKASITTNAKQNNRLLSVPQAVLNAAHSIGFDDALAIFTSGGVGGGSVLTRAQRSQCQGIVRSKIVKELELIDINLNNDSKVINESQPRTLFWWDTNTTSSKSVAAKTTSPSLAIRQLAAEDVMTKAFREAILLGNRADGRNLNQLRDLSCHPDILPSVHGSAFFRRGDTHVLCTTTLGSLEKSSKITFPVNGGPEKTENFFLHYDFPPYCTGELGNATAQNRRMVGHGNLAEKAMRPVMPSGVTFPYTTRVCSECTSSNGSSSMASVCGATISLMDAGVPIKAAVAGLSIGLVTSEKLKLPTEEEINKKIIKTKGKNNDYQLLTDILGMEDHYGDMDFKIAGTSAGITAIQLDIKLENGIPLFILEEALDHAKNARVTILEKIINLIPEPRKKLKLSAPHADLIKFDPERKRFLIGPGGEMLRFIEDTYDVNISTKEEGVAYVYGTNGKNVIDARSFVQDLVSVVSVGDVFPAEVVDIKDYGVMVKITRAQEALLHMSELSHDSNLLRKPMTDLLAIGQRIDVKVLYSDKGTGQVKVSRKSLLSPKDQDLSLFASPPTPDVISIGDLPTFPIIPPRKWNKDYFRDNVATTSEIESTMKSLSNEKSNTSSSLSSSSLLNKGIKDRDNKKTDSKGKTNFKDINRDINKNINKKKNYKDKEFDKEKKDYNKKIIKEKQSYASTDNEKQTDTNNNNNNNNNNQIDSKEKSETLALETETSRSNISAFTPLLKERSFEPFNNEDIKLRNALDELVNLSDSGLSNSSKGKYNRKSTLPSSNTSKDIPDRYESSDVSNNSEIDKKERRYVEDKIIRIGIDKSNNTKTSASASTTSQLINEYSSIDNDVKIRSSFRKNLGNDKEKNSHEIEKNSQELVKGFLSDLINITHDVEDIESETIIKTNSNKYNKNKNSKKVEEVVNEKVNKKSDDDDDDDEVIDENYRVVF